MSLSVEKKLSAASSVTLVDESPSNDKGEMCGSKYEIDDSCLRAYLDRVRSTTGVVASPHHEPDHAGIFRALEKRIISINEETCSPGEENSFFVCDLNELVTLYKNWRKELPRVTPHYAVKCNPNPKLLYYLAQMGVNFDCASKMEIAQILALGIHPDRIVYANPCKMSSYIRFAEKQGVLYTTFDNVEELHKIKKFHPSARLLLRITTDDSTAQCQLSTKYGAALSSVPELLQTCQDLQLNLVGVSFHVGSGASDFSSLYYAIRDARWVFDLAESSFTLPALTLLDVGGGFQLHSFKESSQVLRDGLEKFFPEGCGVRIIAEPGRYFAESTLTLATHVIAKRKVNDDEAMLYINDGVYGNLNCILFDHQNPTPRVLHHSDKFHYFDFDSSAPPHAVSKNHRYKVSIWGPTCDGLDCITKECYLNKDLVVGDWFYFPHLGAYTSSAATPFNGFDQIADTIYINEEEAQANIASL
ncbi:ornithine decarboxylase SPE1 KNAG_0D04510 [Huiozyma naganishii CBS 8797]|uniref:Ornithine decarboxylase n=1 Tax=Huiozyma naganishii (strain ATCC MYA-139 / BCRC 22969 / CBS 8797 / KCTC 17520 / NBRC 10181 / NCYC 3082 / Yp74L-3) TaxID=1071383 RepID=J7S798_HUIN7|nr:hypothetical protein KNAG_0D04510 [Kazachstania naganishii CBS 8797]CCK70196.1 hypothetical protein KNAG_0D04510 [Kazachstania naganishii CBS 8797]